MKGARVKRGQAPPAPAPKVHKTFDDDDESDIDSSTVPDADEPQNAESETDSDSEVEELTMSASRALARQQTAAKIEQRSRVAAQARQSAQPAKPSRRARQQRAHQEATPEEDEDEDEDEDDEPAPERLDPALFAAAFAHTGDAAAREVLRGERTAPIARRSAHARGLDGRPMTRLRGERTTVRALDDAEAPSLADDADAPLSYEAIGVQRPRAAARERAFKKRKLGLRAKDVRASVLEPPRAPKAARAPPPDRDDPLGLHDPAFEQGGEFYQTGAARRRRRSGTARPSAALRARGAGGRVHGTCFF
ncbi:hypothetical protein MCAP1_001550 [Malassezia caprae]|uniref:Uncharacterized protein n=1 Tax=Malassezia caprae TaxID=1381934 RepID=A0AAF0E838_9BASI|nr:hypothetical protein MCAP1_001550 [Malassezia caprae]